MSATKTATTPKTNGTDKPDKPEGIRVPLAQRIRPFNLATTETCRWFDGPWARREPGAGYILDSHGQQIASVDERLRVNQRATPHQIERLLALVLAAPLLLAAVEQYRLHCDAPLALTMAVDKLLESIE